MKKQSVLNLIKYHVEKNENGFRNEAIGIARYFDSIGDEQLAEYIMGLIAESNLYTHREAIMRVSSLNRLIPEEWHRCICRRIFRRMLRE